MVAFDFTPMQGSRNNVTPSWYMKPVNIFTVSQTAGIIALQTTTDLRSEARQNTGTGSAGLADCTGGATGSVQWAPKRVP